MTKQTKARQLSALERAVAEREWRTITLYRAAERVDIERLAADKREKDQRAHAARCIWRAYGSYLAGRERAAQGR